MPGHPAELKHMAADLSSFRFETPAATARGAHVAHVPRGIKSKKDLLLALRSGLRLPDYFGGNWDALEECLKDLSWIPEKNIVVVHDDVPALSPKDAWTYLAILSNAARDWKDGDEHVLEVVFPESAEKVLREKARSVARPERKP